jgi:hypothetical protein
MKYKAWFQPHHEPDLSIFLNDVTCTAFATRLCQRLAGDEKSVAHIPRMQCADEPILNSFTHTGMPWPNLPRARLLVNTALGHSNPPFHLTLRKRTLDHLDTIYQNTAFNNPVLVCKYSALFALGEICSVSGGGTSGGIIPGIDYYTKAISIIPRLPERPSMAHIEALVILVCAIYQPSSLVLMIVVFIQPVSKQMEFRLHYDRNRATSGTHSGPEPQHSSRTMSRSHSTRKQGSPLVDNLHL